MKPGLKAPKQGDRQLSASFLQELGHAVNGLDKLNVAYPLFMSKTPHGILIGSDIGELEPPIIAKATKAAGEDWPSFYDYTLAASNLQTKIWDFEIPSNHFFNEDRDYALYGFGDAGGTNSNWVSNEAPVRAYNLTGHYVYEGAYCMLFKLRNQYYFNHLMPSLLAGKIVGSALSYQSSTTMELAANWDFGVPADDYDPPRVIVHDRNVLTTGYTLAVNTNVLAVPTLYDVSGVPIWRYVVVQADTCVVGE